jgi:hypothetical protein
VTAARILKCTAFGRHFLTLRRNIEVLKVQSTARLNIIER